MRYYKHLDKRFQPEPMTPEDERLYNLLTYVAKGLIGIIAVLLVIIVIIAL